VEDKVYLDIIGHGYTPGRELRIGTPKNISEEDVSKTTLMSLARFIIPRKLKNSGTMSVIVWTDDKYDTTDLVYMDYGRDVNSEIDRENDSVTPVYASDYAILNNSEVSCKPVDGSNRHTTSIYLRCRKTSFDKNVASINTFGNVVATSPTSQVRSIRPAIRIDADMVIGARRVSNNFDMRISKDTSGKDVAIIEFGRFPQRYVGNDLNTELEKLYKRGNLKYTTAQFPIYSRGGVRFSPACTFRDVGTQYVRVDNMSIRKDTVLSDGTKIKKTGKYCWCKVEPIRWIIRNFDKLPKELNPDGDESERFMDLVAEDALIGGMPFYPNNTDDNHYLWQNSTIRGYLNGINVCNIKDNGNPKVSAPRGGGHSTICFNFLANAIGRYETRVYIDEKTMSKDVKSEDKKIIKPRKNSYGIQVVEEPMSVSEQIEFYIKNGKSFMLHGPSGVGKTRRIEEAEPDYESIVLRNGILPEEVIGKTIYPNNDTTKAGTWVPPAWYESLCRKCKEQPEKNHVLFIDEITNVKPSEQSLVFHLVLNNSIGSSFGKLPDNVVVVAAGNSKEESEAAYNMPEPLFRRFSGHIELKPNIQDFLEWGSQPHSENPERSKIHPIVTAFIESKGQQMLYTGYDSENHTKFAVDPRGWEQVSDIIYDNNGKIAKELLINKIGDGIANEFIKFAKNPPLTLQDVLTDNYDEDNLSKNITDVHYLIVRLSEVSIDQVDKVRNFLYRNYGKQRLEMFDMLWAGLDLDKSKYIEEHVICDKNQVKLEESDKSNEEQTAINAYYNKLGKVFAREEYKLFGDD